MLVSASLALLAALGAAFLERQSDAEGTTH
jgi:hypothetical protein